MSTLRDWIEEAAAGEPIEAVVIGELGWGDYSDEVKSPSPVLTWEEAYPKLLYEFDSGFGSPGCHAIYVWTPTRVFFVSQYDGSTQLESVPRNPVPCNPDMPGG